MTASINTRTATMTQLVSFYNEHAPTPVKRFADRATAGKRVQRLVDGMIAETEKKILNDAGVQEGEGVPPEVVESIQQSRNTIMLNALAKPTFIPSYNHQVCPKCGSSEIYNGRTQGGLIVDEDRIAGCHACDWVQDDRRSSNNSAGVSRSWQDPETKVARTTRHAVLVNGTQTFRSTAEAFRQLKLQMSKHIAFRAQLKAAGVLAFDGKFVFAIVAK